VSVNANNHNENKINVERRERLPTQGGETSNFIRVQNSPVGSEVMILFL